MKKTGLLPSSIQKKRRVTGFIITIPATMTLIGGTNMKNIRFDK